MNFCCIIHCTRSFLSGLCSSGSFAMASSIIPVTVCSFDSSAILYHSSFVGTCGNTGFVSQMALLSNVKNNFSILHISLFSEF